MTRLLDFDSDTRTVRGADEQSLAGSTRTSAATVLFRQLVRSLLSSSGAARALLRERVTERLRSAREPFACIDELLYVCTSAGGTDRLDAAIDVLAAADALVLQYAWDYLIRDVQRWDPYAQRAYEPNDDHWYVLLRAVARSNAPPDARLRFILACSGAADRGILEGVVEALGDLGTKEAAGRLRELAVSQADAFIRKLAGDVLDDLE